MQITAKNLIKKLNNSVILEELKITELDDTQFQTILDLIKQKKLSHAILSLDISCNRLTVLPQNIGNLVSLKILNISNNQLAELPDSLKKCTELQALCMAKNYLKSLPEKIGNFKALLKLDLSQNQLSELPASIGSCPVLEWLNIGNNKLTELPPNIGECTELKWLNIGNEQSMFPIPLSEAFNQLTTLPESIGNCKKLQMLDVSYNQLIELPASIVKCAALQCICVSYNYLTELPENIGECTVLQSLHVTNNVLIALPSSIQNCTFLKTLDIYPNPLTLLKEAEEKMINLLQEQFALLHESHQRREAFLSLNLQKVSSAPCENIERKEQKEESESNDIYTNDVLKKLIIIETSFNKLGLSYSESNASKRAKEAMIFSFSTSPTSPYFKQIRNIARTPVMQTASMLVPIPVQDALVQKKPSCCSVM